MSLIHLASRSPRRQELLVQLGLRVQTIAVSVVEQQGTTESPKDYVQRVAAEKAAAGLQLACTPPDVPLLAADTEVVLDGEVLGQPRDESHALDMLARLSGRDHHVLSAVVVCCDGKQLAALQCSLVRFRSIELAEARAYVATGEAYGKAGGYAIQGRAAQFVEHLEGSYSGVMGLPLFETARLLRAAGVCLLPAS